MITVVSGQMRLENGNKNDTDCNSSSDIDNDYNNIVPAFKRGRF